jgi:hypothetical protein
MEPTDSAAMPRYYFYMRNSAPDREGEEFANDEIAREEAKAVARELSRNRAVATDERLIVVDADGRVIHEEPLCPP